MAICHISSYCTVNSEILKEIKLPILPFDLSTWAFVPTDSKLDAKKTIDAPLNVLPLPGWPVKWGSKTRNDCIRFSLSEEKSMVVRRVPPLNYRCQLKF